MRHIISDSYFGGVIYSLKSSLKKQEEHVLCVYPDHCLTSFLVESFHSGRWVLILGLILVNLWQFPNHWKPWNWKKMRREIPWFQAKLVHLEIRQKKKDFVLDNATIIFDKTSTCRFPHGNHQNQILKACSEKTSHGMKFQNWGFPAWQFLVPFLGWWVHVTRIQRLERWPPTRESKGHELNHLVVTICYNLSIKKTGYIS